MAFAYVATYPLLRVRTLKGLMIGDAVVTVALLVLIGVAQGGQSLSLIFFDVAWWVYAIVVISVAELPLFLWYCRRYDVDFSDFSDD